MNKMKLLNYAGAVIILLGFFTPLAYLGNEFITFAPVFNNFVVAGGAWEWMDVSVFVITIFVFTLAAVYFTVDKKYAVNIVLSVLMLVMLLVSGVSFMLTSQKIEKFGTTFSISYGWLFLLAGIIMILVGNSIAWNKKQTK